VIGVIGVIGVISLCSVVKAKGTKEDVIGADNRLRQWAIPSTTKPPALMVHGP